MKRTILVPFVFLIALGFGLGWLAYVGGSRAAVLQTADRLALETALRVHDRLGAYLDSAVTVAEANAAFISSAVEGAGPGAEPLDGLSRVFHRQLGSFPTIDLVCAGFPDGEYAEAQRLADGRIRIGRAGASTGGDLVLESADAAGRPLAEEFRKAAYVPSSRPWYRVAAQAGRTAWSEPYAFVSSGEMAMSASVPVYRGGALVAVVSADIRLGAVSAFLSSIEKELGGLAFVSDASGRVLASSTGLPAAEDQAAAALISAAAAGKSGVPVSVRIDGSAWRALSLVFFTSDGLDWKILVGLPEAAFLAPLAAVDLYTLLIMALTLACSIVLAFLAAARISSPLNELRTAVAAVEPASLGAGCPAIASADADHALELDRLSSRGDEIGSLALAFSSLYSRLDDSFSTLRASLAEKEILLKEVHHRVKNNLQIVSSLLSLQAGSTRDESLRAGLEQLQDRVQAMAFVHEDMYGSGSFDSVGMEAYLRRICDSLSASRRMGTVVMVNVAKSPARLSLDKALPCGLIVCELVTNALKHAFAGRASGEVRVSLLDQGPTLLLRVIDDGIGIEASAAAAKEAEAAAGQEGQRGPSIGASLVEGLSQQLRGELSTDSSATGTTISLRFPSGR